MFRRRRYASWAAWGVAALLLLSGCATPPPADDPEAIAEFTTNNDPLEPMNRALFAVNSGINRAIIGPLAMGYRHAVPRPARDGIRNVLANASSPVGFANDLLRGDPCRAGDTLLRLVINTSFGLGGLFDVAKHMGIPGHDTDFGVTLGVWGVPSGPYLFVPVLNSTNLRDLGGMGVDLAADPWSWAASGVVLDDADWGRLGMYATDTAERWLDRVREINRTALDPYSAYRSIYRQHRQFTIERAKKPDQGVVCGDSPYPP